MRPRVITGTTGMSATDLMVLALSMGACSVLMEERVSMSAIKVVGLIWVLSRMGLFVLTAGLWPRDGDGRVLILLWSFWFMSGIALCSLSMKRFSYQLPLCLHKWAENLADYQQCILLWHVVSSTPGALVRIICKGRS